MKIFSRTFYFTVIPLLLLIFLLSLKFEKNKEEKVVGTSPITIEVVEGSPSTIESDRTQPVVEQTVENSTAIENPSKESPPKNSKSVQLDVPFFKQEYIRSCEEASLRMVLAFYGIETNDREIVERVGYEPRSWDKENNIWDDPNIMFVGYIDDPNKNGYGAFAPAIAAAAKTFGRDSESYTDVSAQFLAEHIYAGHPVIVWGFNLKSLVVKYFWNTDEGKEIVAYRGEHTRVVVGVFGDPSKPVGFLLHDPLSGEKNEYWSSERLMTHMNTLGNLTNQAVVVQ